MNALHPFTYDAHAEREGLLVTEMFNSRRKKQVKSHELFPYLDRKTPDWLVDPAIRTAKELIARHEEGCKLRGEKPNYDYVRRLIIEELQIEHEKTKPDSFKIKELNILLGVVNNGKVVSVG